MTADSPDSGTQEQISEQSEDHMALLFYITHYFFMLFSVSVF